MSDTIEVNGIKYDADEITQRTLVIKGMQPTDFESYQFLEVLAELRNKKPNAGGRAQAGYRYAELSDHTKFNEHQYPYKADVKMITTVDKKGEQVQEIIWVDFANIQELVTIPRKEYERLTATGSQKSAAQTQKA
tara:strand:- start:211 stop:615 length:405 start_codon:yes stop_codon:yes gene_type:complete